MFSPCLLHFVFRTQIVRQLYTADTLLTRIRTTCYILKFKILFFICIVFERPPEQEGKIDRSCRSIEVAVHTKIQLKSIH